MLELKFGDHPVLMAFLCLWFEAYCAMILFVDITQREIESGLFSYRIFGKLFLKKRFFNQLHRERDIVFLPSKLQASQESSTSSELS